MIITSVSALYDFGYINYKPAKTFVEMPVGTNSSAYYDKYFVHIQNLDTLNVGVIQFNNKKYYCPERLFIEFEKYPLENTIKSGVIEKLEKDINPQKVFHIYEKIKNKRRNINRKRIEAYLDKNVLRIYDILSENSNDKERVIREYIAYIFSTKDVPVSLIKGGAAVELFVDFKRATQDIDAHIDYNNVHNLLKILKNNENIIYFDFDDNSFININKPIFCINLKAKSRKIKLNEILKTIPEIKITFNTTYTDQQIKQFINEYKITKVELKVIKNAHALVFTKEMILAEKFHTLIYQNKNCTRTKDLIDLANMYDDEIDFNKFIKWLLRKWSNKRVDALNEKQVYKFIADHKNIELTKIKDNFRDAVRMYDTNLTYEDAISVYYSIINRVLSTIK